MHALLVGGRVSGNGGRWTGWWVSARTVGRSMVVVVVAEHLGVDRLPKVEGERAQDIVLGAGEGCVLHENPRSTLVSMAKGVWGVEADGVFHVCATAHTWGLVATVDIVETSVCVLLRMLKVAGARRGS